MSDLYFPSTPGLTWDVKPTPAFSTVRQRDRARRETRICNDPYPLWTFELSWEFLRDYNHASMAPQRSAGAATATNPQGLTDLELIVGFFCARQGSFDSFLLDPGLLTGRPNDSQSTGAPLGTGDGVTTAFQLQRRVGSFMDIVEAPRSTAQIFANGAQVTAGWTQSPTGLITFSAPPAAGVALTASVHWAYRVHFAEDSITPEMFQFQLYELQSVKLEQDRQ